MEYDSPPPLLQKQRDKLDVPPPRQISSSLATALRHSTVKLHSKGILIIKRNDPAVDNVQTQYSWYYIK